MAQWIQGTVAANLHWTDNLFSLQVEAGVDAFTADQFTSLALDIDGERVARPYSYLSPPGQQPLEFFLYTAVNGVLSNALVRLEPGDRLWLKQRANGFFVLDEIPDCRELWMLGTGTGIAPFLSILNTDTPWRRFDKIVLVHAVRTLADLRYQEQVQSFAARYGDQFLFQAFISREVVEDTIHGRIPVTLEDGSLERKLGLPLETDKSHLMLCGNPDMVKDVIAVLKDRGFSRNRRRTPGHITVENYW